VAKLIHVKWECKFHVVIVPKYRKKVLFGQVRRDVGKIIRQLCRQKDVELIERHAMPDHIYLVLSVPPKYSIAMVMGYLKGKSAFHIHRQLQGVKQGFTGKHFWSRDYCVSPIAWMKKPFEPM
jgi:putative transposase